MATYPLLAVGQESTLRWLLLFLKLYLSQLLKIQDIYLTIFNSCISEI